MRKQSFSRVCSHDNIVEKHDDESSGGFMDCAKEVPDCGVMKVLRRREEGDLALEVEEEAGGELQHRGLRPTEDRFMRLDDMERFVRAAEQREMDDDEDDEDLTGDDSGDNDILTICCQARADICCI